MECRLTWPTLFLFCQAAAPEEARNAGCAVAEKYFDMQKKNARDALDLYKKFLTRMDNVAEFLKVAEAVGIDKGEIPDLARAPHSLLEALEAHLASLEGRPGRPSPTSSNYRDELDYLL